MVNFKYFDDVISLEFDQEKCIGCGLCSIICPHGVFVGRKGNKADMVSRERCMECGACMRNCPSGAIIVEAGEGCVRAVINELLGIDGPCC